MSRPRSEAQKAWRLEYDRKRALRVDLVEVRMMRREAVAEARQLGTSAVEVLERKVAEALGRERQKLAASARRCRAECRQRRALQVKVHQLEAEIMRTQ